MLLLDACLDVVASLTKGEYREIPYGQFYVTPFIFGMTFRGPIAGVCISWKEGDGKVGVAVHYPPSGCIKFELSGWYLFQYVSLADVEKIPFLFYLQWEDLYHLSKEKKGLGHAISAVAHERFAFTYRPERSLVEVFPKKEAFAIRPETRWWELLWI